MPAMRYSTIVMLPVPPVVSSWLYISRSSSGSVPACRVVAQSQGQGRVSLPCYLGHDKELVISSASRCRGVSRRCCLTMVHRCMRPTAAACITILLGSSKPPSPFARAGSPAWASAACATSAERSSAGKAPAEGQCHLAVSCCRYCGGMPSVPCPARAHVHAHTSSATGRCQLAHQRPGVPAWPLARRQQPRPVGPLHARVTPGAQRVRCQEGQAGAGCGSHVRRLGSQLLLVHLGQRQHGAQHALVASLAHLQNRPRSMLTRPPQGSFARSITTRACAVRSSRSPSKLLTGPSKQLGPQRAHHERRGCRAVRQRGQRGAHAVAHAPKVHRAQQHAVQAQAAQLHHILQADLCREAGGRAAGLGQAGVRTTHSCCPWGWRCSSQLPEKSQAHPIPAHLQRLYRDRVVRRAPHGLSARLAQAAQIVQHHLRREAAVAVGCHCKVDRPHGCQPAAPSSIGRSRASQPAHLVLLVLCLGSSLCLLLLLLLLPLLLLLLPLLEVLLRSWGGLLLRWLLLLLPLLLLLLVRHRLGRLLSSCAFWLRVCSWSSCVSLLACSSLCCRLALSSCSHLLGLLLPSAGSLGCGRCICCLRCLCCSSSSLLLQARLGSGPPPLSSPLKPLGPPALQRCPALILPCQSGPARHSRPPRQRCISCLAPCRHAGSSFAKGRQAHAAPHLILSIDSDSSCSAASNSTGASCRLRISSMASSSRMSVASSEAAQNCTRSAPGPCRVEHKGRPLNCSTRWRQLCQQQQLGGGGGGKKELARVGKPATSTRG
jgi:hypothetical protein